MKLRAYQIHPDFKLRRAPLERQWMDATYDAYAYRCLPLNIANQHGWEILSPVRFQAYWDGREANDSVHFITEHKEDRRPHSAFGSGVMTFPVPFLFRTEPGIQLFATGPVNMQKDGIQPLSGIIETDWSPYTFTMNYRFTRPNHIITFEAGEPYIMLFPVRMDLIEDVEPDIVPIHSNKELCAMFEDWRDNRKAFYDVARVDQDSDEFKQGWQKSYFQGYRPNGEKAPVKHRTKLRLRSFEHVDPETVTNLEAADPACDVKREGSDD